MKLAQINRSIRSLKEKAIKETSMALTKEDLYLVNKHRSNCLLIIRETKI